MRNNFRVFRRNKKQKGVLNMKKNFIILVMSLMCILTFTFVGCGGTKDNGDGGGTGKFQNLTTTESVYGFSAASAGMIVSSMNNGTASQHISAKRFANNQTVNYTDETGGISNENNAETPSTPENNSGTQNADIAEIEKYMALVESLLSDGNFSFDSQTSDREGYSEKTVISYMDMDGKKLQYVMYYNQVHLGTEVNNNSSEVEENYSINGVMVIDGKDYKVHGEKKNETEPNEIEVETEFVVEIGETSYIRVEQSFETETNETEQKYSYSLYEGSELVERSTFSYETEQNETELKMSTYKNGNKQVIYFEKELKNSEEVIKIQIVNGTSSKGYIVRIQINENGDRHYVYEEAKLNN